MNTFSEQIKKLELDFNDTYDIKKGQIPIILTSAHGIEQKKRGGRIKPAEPFTRGIARYVNKKTDCYYLIKNEDTGIDPNKKNNDEFKNFLIELIEKNQIRLLIDLHGAKKERDFDVEIGTLDGKTLNQKTLDKLVECFNKNGIHNIAFNEPFKGGFITQTMYEQAKIKCVQIEINSKLRSLYNMNSLNKVCRALIRFVKEVAL